MRHELLGDLCGKLRRQAAADVDRRQLGVLELGLGGEFDALAARVAVLGALAMAITAGIGHLFGAVV